VVPGLDEGGEHVLAGWFGGTLVDCVGVVALLEGGGGGAGAVEGEDLMWDL